LFGACHEEPARPGGRGFDLWPKTRWIWSFQLARQSGVLHTKLHRGRSLYLSMEGARVFDPLVRRAIEEAAGDEAVLLAHLAEQGASMSADLELELGWDRKRLKRARDRLERVGAVVSDGLVFDDDSNPYFAPLRRWDQVFSDEVPAREPLLDVVVAGVQAAVIAPEANIRSWFNWPIPSGMVETLVASGRLVSPRPGWLAIGRQ
jgi:hypothetical protein